MFPEIPTIFFCFGKMTIFHASEEHVSQEPGVDELLCDKVLKVHDTGF